MTRIGAHIGAKMHILCGPQNLTAVTFSIIQATVQPIRRFNWSSSREISKDRLSQVTLSNKSAIQNTCTYLMTIGCIFLFISVALMNVEIYLDFLIAYSSLEFISGTEVFLSPSGNILCSP